MGKIIAALIAMGLLFTSAYSKNNSYSIKFPNRHVLDLPNECITTPKLINAITEILPMTHEVLKDKEFCTECEAGYSIKLVIDLPGIKSSNNISKGLARPGKYYSFEVVYQFRAALELYDSTGEDIIGLVLVLAEEERMKKKDTVINTMEYGFSPIEIKDMYGGTVATVIIPSFNSNSIPITNTLSPSLI